MMLWKEPRERVLFFRAVPFRIYTLFTFFYPSRLFLDETRRPSPNIPMINHCTTRMIPP